MNALTDHRHLSDAQHGPQHGLSRLVTPPPQHDARSLTKGGVQAQITLDGQIYTLRITRQGKLILTK